ncbi:MOSC domain-containing protein [Planctomicrobium sp. SH661]|uniref:MOSC domain-containing protein n=1 Tax=Planctomicrobium sp. SH661 TaxID=3448124 RepID=UPI003F5C1A76
MAAPLPSDVLLVSIQVGLPQTYGDASATDPREQQWRTGFFKKPISGPCRVTLTGLDGDGQADLRVHGGPDKAILAYSADHYPAWRKAIDHPDMTGGAFGENLTISGLTEESVCIGDEWAIGSVRLQVSQPRQPCWKLARRWGVPELPKLVVRSGWSGWYFRVLQTGEIEPGQKCVLEHRPHGEWSIARTSQALYDRNFPLAAAEELARLPELSAAWQEDLQGRLGSRIS